MKKIKSNNFNSTVLFFSNFGYILGCLLLYIISLIIMASAVYGIIIDLFYSEVFDIYAVLNEVGLLVFSVAVIDIGKYLMLEEVLTEKQKDPHVKASQTLPKFVIIIVSALSLEGLVLTIKFAKSDITKVIYPSMLLIVAVLFIIAIGIFQRLSNTSTKK